VRTNGTDQEIEINIPDMEAKVSAVIMCMEEMEEKKDVGIIEGYMAKWNSDGNNGYVLEQGG